MRAHSHPTLKSSIPSSTCDRSHTHKHTHTHTHTHIHTHTSALMGRPAWGPGDLATLRGVLTDQLDTQCQAEDFLGDVLPHSLHMTMHSETFSGFPLYPEFSTAFRSAQGPCCSASLHMMYLLFPCISPVTTGIAHNSKFYTLRMSFSAAGSTVPLDLPVVSLLHSHLDGFTFICVPWTDEQHTKPNVQRDFCMTSYRCGPNDPPIGTKNGGNSAVICALLRMVCTLVSKSPGEPGPQVVLA